jgi:uncharacterized protein (TIGR00299 family) protein
VKIAYGDLIGGVSGDMFVAALLDIGLPLAALKAELKKIPTLKFDLKASKKTVSSIRALQFRVICAKQEKPRAWKKIRRILQRSRLSAAVKETGIEIFRRLAEAEAKVHGIAVDRVHFHEVGATDSIADIMAAAIGCHHLKIRALHFSRVPLGRGLTRGGHGSLPVPGPATLELLKDIPVEWTQLNGETVTPTGAAIIATLGKSFGAEPSMTIEKIGYGAGAKEWPDRPNLFRLVLGEDNAGWRNEEMVVLETNIDDMNPQFYDHVMDRLFAAGARDVFLAPIQMKKNRPATLLTVICEPTRRAALAEIILQETSTIGIRYYPVNRMVLKRESKKVQTRFGRVTVKLVEQPDGTKRATPEYDDLKRIAAAKKIPLKLLHDEVLRGFRK